MSVYASSVRMVCKKNTSDLYWFGPRNALCPVGEESSVLSYTKVFVVGVTSECERGSGSQVSRCEWSACVCDPTGALARSRRVMRSCIVLCLCEGSSFFLFFLFLLERSLYAPFIASSRCRVTRCWYVGDPCWRSSPGASGVPYLVATWSVL
jgi:hypothetical protein